MSEQPSPRYTVSAAVFSSSASGPEHFPPGGAPEIAFFGRSNVGKSSLLNALVEQKSLAHTGKTPGRTRLLNFFSVKLKDRGVEPAEFRNLTFVDVPGYGYAGVSHAEKANWNKLLAAYLLDRAQLRMLLLLVDGRREPEEDERWVAEVAAGREFLVVITKADKLNRSERAQAKRRIAEGLGVPERVVFVTSSAKGREGIAALRDRIAASAFEV